MLAAAEKLPASGNIREPALRISSPWGPLSLPELTCALPGGLIGHYQRTLDDCGQATLATYLQIPYEDADADTRCDVDFQAWLARRGIASWIHYQPATHEPWWIAISEVQETGRRHWLVFSYHRLVHDPFAAWRPDDPNLIPQPYTLADIEFGVTVKRPERN